MLRKILFTTGIVFLIIFCSCSMRNKLEIWSFTDEFTKEDVFGKIIEDYYQDAFPKMVIDYSVTSAEQFPKRLDPVLKKGRGVPDVLIFNSSFVRKYAESGLLLDLTDIYEKNKDKLFLFTAEAGVYEGRVYAMSWQAAPGAMFYRRTLARKYLGTDNPQVVQSYFADFNNLLNTARILKARSEGNCFVTASLEDLHHVFFSARQDPWINKNGSLVIDPLMEQYFYIAKEMYENNWTGSSEQWSEGWYAGMRDELKNVNGNPAEVFAYFLPTWGLEHILKDNAENTSGDWAMIQGPAAYYWGGAWIGAWKKTGNPEGVNELIEWLITDNDFLSQYAKDTNDLISNFEILNSIKDEFIEPFLDGQNHIYEFAEIAKDVNGRLAQETDSVIQEFYIESLMTYVNGTKNREEAITEFKDKVKSEFNIN